jgi:hypothetical protein
MVFTRVKISVEATPLSERKKRPLTPRPEIISDNFLCAFMPIYIFVGQQ